MRRLIYCICAMAMIFLAGCSKEYPAEEQVVEATFNISVENITKAAGDGDGAADRVNRYILEAYLDGGKDFYTRDIVTVEPGTKEAEFAIKLESGRTYDFLFWADCGTDGEDLYYRTTSEKGLRAIEMTGRYSGNNDSRDAFCASKSIYADSSFRERVILRRPFAQLNVITTDIDDIYQDFMLPQEVSMSFIAKTMFDVFSGECTGDEVELSYSAVPYYKSHKIAGPAENRSDVREWTLSMDYLFAPSQEAEIAKVTVGLKANGNPLPSKTITNVPFRRNYRTNITGNLMTVNGTCKVSISPEWSDTQQITR